VSNTKPPPEGVPVVIPRLFCRDPVAEIDFLAHTFNARELNRRPGPDGAVVHALLTIGPAMVMIESEWPQITNRAPKLDGSSPVALYAYVEDVDAAVERAVDGSRSVLGRPHSVDHGPVGPRVDDLDAHRRADRRGAAGASGADSRPPKGRVRLTGGSRRPPVPRPEACLSSSPRLVRRSW
jgi:uncharacterized glyoxalase superfamily protein PhnB